MQIYSDKCFRNPLFKIEANGLEEVENALVRIQSLRKRYYLVGCISYDFDYLYFEAFEGFDNYSPRRVERVLGILNRPLVSKSAYIRAIEKIKDYISLGETYEVNYTYPYEVCSNLDGIDLYEALVHKQRTSYNAYISNDKFNLLSFSPELFFRISGNKIYTKPMKGTIGRGDTPNEDESNKEFLYNDVKNRAENIMIVDLLRNDLGKIAKVGSVRVDKLFDIEAHPTLYQMTSEISAKLEDSINLADIFKAIFPCGSITGAPKKSTMRIINELEPFNRWLYCGAIGFLSPDVIEFSVPIRILYGKNYRYKYHVGGAIVWDSNSEDEWQETLTKKKIIDTDFQIIETMVDDFESHILRMKESAEFFSFRWNSEIENLNFKQGVINRITLSKNGDYLYKTFFPSVKENNKVRIKGRVNSNNIFLYHKTTIREKVPDDVYEEIRVNERGEITEGTYTNIAVEISGKLYTPPISCGLLNGTYRQRLINDGILYEKVLYPKDLQNADKIYCFNSVRKMVEVELCL